MATDAGQTEFRSQLKQARKLELSLLLDEERAEKRYRKAIRRLQRAERQLGLAQAEVESRQARLADAESVLREVELASDQGVRN